MEFGMFHEFPALPGRSDSDSFAEAMAQVDAAERFGLDAMWLAELHFAPKRSVLSSPLGVACAIAMRTRRMKIGIAVQVLPLAHPLRLAEEAATVDQLSSGRLIFGVGRSGQPRTYEAYGIPYAESRDRFAEALEIIKLAWTEPQVSYAGRFHKIENVVATPKPFQKPLPPIRVAATSSDTFPVNGQLGYPIFIAVRNGSITDLGPDIERYREAWAKAGHPGQGEVYLRTPVYIATDEARARAEPERSMMQFFRNHAQLLKDAAARSGEQTVGQRLQQSDQLENLTYDVALRDKAIVGTPQMVIDKLAGLRETLGLDGILAELNCGGLIPHDGVMTALQLLCEEVQPRFH